MKTANYPAFLAGLLVLLSWFGKIEFPDYLILITPEMIISVEIKSNRQLDYAPDSSIGDKVLLASAKQ